MDWYVATTIVRERSPDCAITIRGLAMGHRFSAEGRRGKRRRRKEALSASDGQRRSRHDAERPAPSPLQSSTGPH
jgi:hypothetical protein